MTYSEDLGRRFWHDFDQHFKYEAPVNGLLEVYKGMGGQDAAASAWQASREANDPAAFAAFARNHAEAIATLADKQKEFFQDHFPDRDDLTAAFRDFAFGILESADAEHRVTADDGRHGMSGGVYADGYLHWHGFIEAAALLEPEDDFWPFLRRVNAMAWELHVRAHPDESDPEGFDRLPEAETARIREKWFAMSDEQIAKEFDQYPARARQWSDESRTTA